ncbi:hypothetical protein EOM09_03370 [bacterium]|nr:hypothetical protein [bacterium]
MLFKNNKGQVGNIMGAMLGGIMTTIGVLVISKVNTAANLTSGSMEKTFTDLMGGILAVGGLIFILVSVIGFIRK